MSPTLEPTDPKRVRSFALFFKNYMSISTLVVAALPVPVTSLKIIPSFAAQTKVFSVYTSLFCFLLLGFIFYLRHMLARVMFPEFFDPLPTETTPERIGMRWWPRRTSLRRARMWFINMLPLFFITSSLILAFQYNDVLKSAVNSVRMYNVAVRRFGADRVFKSGPEGSWMIDNAPNDRPIPSYTEEQYPITFKGILAATDLNDIFYGSRLMILYIGIFLMAEAAFILMAIKEYLQDLVGLTDVNLIDLRQAGAIRAHGKDGETEGSAPPSDTAP